MWSSVPNFFRHEAHPNRELCTVHRGRIFAPSVYKDALRIFFLFLHLTAFCTLRTECTHHYVYFNDGHFVHMVYYYWHKIYVILIHYFDKSEFSYKYTSFRINILLWTRIGFVPRGGVLCGQIFFVRTC